MFVGGTGRSGTTLIQNILGRHDDIYAMEKEMRFLSDPNGLNSLVDNLTHRYNNISGMSALSSFERLMRDDLTAPAAYPYFGYDFGSTFGGELYFRRLEIFISTLTSASFAGKAGAMSSNCSSVKSEVASFLWRFAHSLGHDKSKVILRRASRLIAKHNECSRFTKSAKYFPVRKELIALSAHFVDEMFAYPTKQAGKSIWSEKTPNNLLAINFIQELFPNSLFIHVKRDPRGVIASMQKMPWAPSDIETLCVWAKPDLEKWFHLESSESFNRQNYLEFKLEDFAKDPQQYLTLVATKLNVEADFGVLSDVSENRVSGWKHQMSAKDIQTINKVLGDYVTHLGYNL